VITFSVRYSLFPVRFLMFSFVFFVSFVFP